MQDGIQVLRRTTIERICQAVRELFQAVPEGAVQAPAAAATAMAGAGCAAPSAVSVLVATATPTVGTAQQTVAGPLLTVRAGTGLTASTHPAVCLVVAPPPFAVQLGPSCVFITTSSSLLTPRAVAVVATAMVAVLG
jgi:hypothetical protein